MASIKHEMWKRMRSRGIRSFVITAAIVGIVIGVLFALPLWSDFLRMRSTAAFSSARLELLAAALGVHVVCALVAIVVALIIWRGYEMIFPEERR